MRTGVLWKYDICIIWIGRSEWGGRNKHIFRVSTEIHVVCSEKTAGKKRYGDTWTHHAHQSLKIKADCFFFVSTLSAFVFYDYIIISFVKVFSLILEWRRCISRCNLPRFSYSDFASKPIFQFFFSKFYSAYYGWIIYRWQMYIFFFFSYVRQGVQRLWIINQ